MSRSVAFPVMELLALSVSMSVAAGGCADRPAPAAAAAPSEVRGTHAVAAEPPTKPASSAPEAGKPSSPQAPEVAKPPSPQAPAAATEACEGGRGCGDAGRGESCEGASAPLRNPSQRRVKTASGQRAVHVGDAFSAAEEVPVVKVSALLAEPDKWAGKRVRVQGDVTAMCHHKRGWFAVAAEDKSGRALRVITTPVFLVPRGSIGRTAATEGRVEVIQVPARFARHMADEHKIGDSSKMRGPQRRVILRATGAEFQ